MTAPVDASATPPRRTFGGVVGTAVGVVGVLIAIVRFDVDLREPAGTMGTASLTTTILLLAWTTWFSVLALRHRREAQVLWPHLKRPYLFMALLWPLSSSLSLNVVFIDPPPASLVAAGVISATTSSLSFLLFQRYLAPTKRPIGPFPHAAASTLVLFCLLALLATPAPPAIAGAPTRVAVSIAEAAEDSVPADPPSTPSTAAVSSPTIGQCPVDPGEGAPPDVRTLMRLASEEGADVDYDCLTGPAFSMGGTWQHHYQRGDAVLIGSRLGAGVVNGVWRASFEEVGGGELSVGALGGQVVNRFDCGPGDADVQVVVGNGHRIVLIASRIGKFAEDGEVHPVWLTPSTLVAEYARRLAGGQVLVAVGPVVHVGSIVEQGFIDTARPNQHVTLTARASSTATDISLIPPEFTLKTLYEACVGEPVPPSMDRAG